MIKLNHFDKEHILSDFPKIKLSYENVIHKKVYNTDNNFVMAIPYGKKCFAWFTYYNNKNSCILLIIDNNSYYKSINEINDIKIMNCCFNYELCFGTLFYGTLFNYNNNNFFTIEDIYYYKSKYIHNISWINKLELTYNIMTYDIKQLSYNKHFIVFGVPLIYTNFEDLYKNINNIEYKLNYAQFRNYNRSNVSYNLLLNDFEYFLKIKINIKNNEEKSIRNNQEKDVRNNENIKNNKLFQTKNDFKNNIKREIVFQIRPDIQNDIYYLYCKKENGELINYDIALIPDFNTSVMMNNLFRNIKENSNLDLLEESDDEEEFENENKDKFVFLDKTIDMICNYNYKFKKWIPIKVIDDRNKNNYKIIDQNDLLHYEKNKH